MEISLWLVLLLLAVLYTVLGVYRPPGRIRRD
jgi:hypothetical protein